MSVARAVDEVGGETVALRPADSVNGMELEAVNGMEVLELPSSIRCLETLLDHADAVVLLPGDLTAMAVLLQIWAFGHRSDSPFRPILLLGEKWPALVKAVADAALRHYGWVEQNHPDGDRVDAYWPPDHARDVADSSGGAC